MTDMQETAKKIYRIFENDPRLREYTRDIEASVEAGCKMPGANGAACRLSKVIGVWTEQKWQMDEAMRGTSWQDQIKALTLVLASEFVLPLAMSFEAAPPQLIAAEIIAELEKTMIRVLSGAVPVEGIRVAGDGVRDVTTIGLAREHMENFKQAGSD